MEYFKVTDKAIGGDSYYVKFIPNDTSMNITGKAEIIRCIRLMDGKDNEECFFYVVEKHDFFDMNTVEIDYELDVNDWAQMYDYVDKKTTFNKSLQEFDPLLVQDFDPLVSEGEITELLKSYCYDEAYLLKIKEKLLQYYNHRECIGG